MMLNGRRKQGARQRSHHSINYRESILIFRLLLLGACINVIVGWISRPLPYITRPLHQPNNLEASQIRCGRFYSDANLKIVLGATRTRPAPASSPAGDGDEEPTDATPNQGWAPRPDAGRKAPSKGSSFRSSNKENHVHRHDKSPSDYQGRRGAPQEGFRKRPAPNQQGSEDYGDSDFKRLRRKENIRETTVGASGSSEIRNQRLLTVRLKDAAITKGIEALLLLAEQNLSKLNSVHCAMILSRISKEPNRDVILKSPGFANIMEQASRVFPRDSRARDVAQASNSLSRMRDNRMARWQEFINILHERALELLPEMLPKEVALVVNGFANLPHPPGPAYWHRYSEYFQAHANQYDKQGLSMVLNGFGKMGYRPDRRLLELVEELTLELLEECNTQELANLLNAYPKFDYVVQPDYLAKFERLSFQKLDDFKPQELSMTLNAMAKLSYRPSDKYLDRFQKAAIRAMPFFKPQESAIVINAFTHMTNYLPGETFWSELVRHVPKRVKQHGPQEVANTLHGMGKLGYNPPPEFVHVFMEHAMTMMERFKTQELANMINGLSKMTTRPSSAFFYRFLDVSQPLLSHFTTQEISNLVNGIMKMGYKVDDAYLDSTVQAVTSKFHQFKDQEMAMTFHAYGRFQYYPGDAFMKLYDKEVWKRVEGFTSQALSMTLNAYSRLGWRPTVLLLEEIERGLERAIKDNLLMGAELAQALNGMANLNYVPGRNFLASLKTITLDQRNFIDLSTVAVTLWSLSALDVPRMKGFLSEMVEVACRRLEGHQPDALPQDFEERASMFYSNLNEPVPTAGTERLEPPMVMCVRQLMQTCRYLTTLKNPISSSLYQRFAKLLELKWSELQFEKYETHTSFFHRDVLGVIEQAFGLRCDIEVEDEAYTIDMVIYPEDGGPPVAVEADGPHHFFRNVPGEPMGFTNFKHRLLKARPDRWRSVISVSQMEWMRAREKDPHHGRTKLMIEKFREAGLDLEIKPPTQDSS